MSKVETTITRLRADIQARDWEGTTTVLTRDIHTLLGHIKDLQDRVQELSDDLSSAESRIDGLEDKNSELQISLDIERG